MKKIMTLKECIKYLSISESLMRKLVREKRIPYFRVGSKLLFDQVLIDIWLDESVKGADNND